MEGESEEERRERWGDGEKGRDRAVQKGRVALE